MVRTYPGILRQLGTVTRLAGLGLLSVVLGACVTSATASPQANTSAAPATATAAGTQVTAAPPSATRAPISTAADQWTSIKWSVGAPVGLPARSEATTNPDDSGIAVDFGVFGWSGGYVAMRSIQTIGKEGLPVATRLVPYTSPDGVTWTEGVPLDVKGLDAAESVGEVVEGPAGLLAVGYPEAATCSGPTPIDALWLSANGSSWRRVSSPKIYSMDAGSAGYVATDLDAHVWTSTDATSWHETNMTVAALKGIQVQDATAFSGGFVVAAAAPVPDSEGCGASQLKTPSLWWSASGSTWTRDELPSVPTGSDVWVSVKRITDKWLLAIGEAQNESSEDLKFQTWTSTDGKTWTAESEARFGNGEVLGNGRNSLLATTADDGTVSLFAFGPNQALVPLPQTGDVPTAALADGADIVVGPHGLVVVSGDGLHLWVGVPGTH